MSYHLGDINPAELENLAGIYRVVYYFDDKILIPKDMSLEEYIENKPPKSLLIMVPDEFAIDELFYVKLVQGIPRLYKYTSYH